MADKLARSLLVGSIILSVVFMVAVLGGAFVLHRELIQPQHDFPKGGNLHLAFAEDVQISGQAIVLLLPLVLIALAYLICRTVAGGKLWIWSFVIALVALGLDWNIMTFQPFDVWK